MTEPLRVALLGYGLAGRVFHRPLIAVEPGLRLDAVVTASPDRAAAAAADEPGVRVLSSADEVWENTDAYDVVVVATANVVHVEQARAALERGLHVVLDKPMAPDAATAADLADLADAVDRRLIVFQNRRWDAELRTVQRLMAEGVLGPVHRLESRFERWRPTPKGGWRELPDPDQMGGLLYDLGSHLVDQALLLLGPVASVYCVSRAVRGDGLPDDDTQFLLRHTSGAVSLLYASAASAFTVPRFRVLGTRGGYQVDALDSQEDRLREGALPGPEWGREPESAWGVLVDADGGTTVVPSEAGRWPEFYAGVVACLRDGAAPPVDVRDVVQDLRVIDAARESARTGAAVVLDPPAGHLA